MTTVFGREDFIEIHTKFISALVLGPTGQKHPVSYFQNSRCSLERLQKGCSQETKHVLVALVLQI